MKLAASRAPNLVAAPASRGPIALNCPCLIMFHGDNSSLVRVWKPESMDWYWRETITGKPHISWQKPMLSCSALPIQWQQGNALWSHISWSASVKQPMDCSFSGKLCTLSEPILGTPNLQGENHLQIDGCWFTWNMKVSTMATSSFSLNHNNAKLGCPS